MKPRTKLQLRVSVLAKYLLGLSIQQKQWAYKECLEHRAYATKNRVLCLDCGDTFPPALVVRNKAVCPHCDTKVEVKDSRCTTDKQTNYFAIAEVMEEFQIIRNYEIIAYYKKGIPAKYYLHEILQYWVQPDGKTTNFGLSHNSNWCMDSWGGDMEIRIAGNSYYNRDKYDVYARKYHPISVFKDEYKKHGIDENLNGISFLEAIKLIPNNPKVETLLKLKQYSILQAYAGSHSGSINRYWASLKICFRNKYKIKDASMYFDYLDLLHYFKKDVRNAKFICPKDLKKEHDCLMVKKREILRIEEQERIARNITKKQENLEKDIVQYVERFNKFFDLKFTEGSLSIQLLKSVEEFKLEGDKLKHCVYTNEYYLKENSLIFSAKINGKRTETIELTIHDMTIQQSRGLNNKPTKYHDKIIELMNKNIPKIRQQMKVSKPKKVKQQIQISA